MKIRRLFCI